MLCKHVSCMVLEIFHVVVYAKTSLLRTEKTSAGRTRWRCKNCGASSTQTRETATRKAQFRMFQKWLESNQPRQDFSTSTRSFTRHTQWCWNVAPSVVPTGEIHHQIMLDGTYFNGWCVLIAHTGTHVIDWQWCDRERGVKWFVYRVSDERTS